MRILIVDDEAPTRVRLRQTLAAHRDVTVAGEGGTGVEAIEMIAQLRPDVILLDIRMPGSSGLDVAACLPKPRPHVVFCTAFDQHAVEAFDLHAVDYLLKPVARARLAQTLDRIRSLPAAGAVEEAVDRAIRGQQPTPSRFLVRSGAQYLVVPEAHILYFGTEGSLTRLVTATAQHWMDPSLNELEDRLTAGMDAPARFFRISRAALINLNAVAEVVLVTGGSGEVVLKNGHRLDVSRRRFRDLLEALAGISAQAPKPG
jgi:two-component system, LytTR family, response regulator